VYLEPRESIDLARLRQERDAADRAYNDALTALDQALQRMRDLPPPPPSFDEARMAELNERWPVASGLSGGGLLRRLRRRLLAPFAGSLERQQAFNAALVDHLNRQAAVHRATAQTIADLTTVCREELARLAHFQSRLIQYAQQITAFVDTKDRYIAALPQSLAAGLSGLADDIQKRWESMVARERRYDAQVADIRATLSVVHRALLTIKRDVESRVSAPAQAAATGAVAPAAPAVAGSLDAYKYVGFEDQFRGSTAEIRERAAAYVKDFAGARDVLDVGCGRGEFLDLLRGAGITARGVDLNDEMAALCRERGLEATAGDALTYLLAQPDESLGGLFAAQVVEHLEPAYLMRLLETAYHKLRPGSTIILETINPACWYAFFSSYIRDVTHVQPLHPETLQYFLTASGFQRVAVRYSAPASEELRLEKLPERDDAADEVRAFNANVDKLNGLMFSYLDYAAIGQKG
jgi:SAM-dependent methyltransferase